jgi:hypothetical protein
MFSTIPNFELCKNVQGLERYVACKHWMNVSSFSVKKLVKNVHYFSHFFSPKTSMKNLECFHHFFVFNVKKLKQAKKVLQKFQKIV